MSLAGLEKLMPTINEKPKSAKPSGRPMPQSFGKSGSISMTFYPRNTPKLAENCRNCGAPPTSKRLTCDYCGSVR